jgi:hypothetical protein
VPAANVRLCAGDFADTVPTLEKRPATAIRLVQKVIDFYSVLVGAPGLEPGTR